MKSPMARQPFDETKTDRENGYQPAMVRIEVSPEEVVGPDGTSSRVARLTELLGLMNLVQLVWSTYKTRIDDVAQTTEEIRILNEQILNAPNEEERARLNTQRLAQLGELHRKTGILIEEIVQDDTFIRDCGTQATTLFGGLLPEVQQWWWLSDVSLRPMMRKRDKPRAEETEETAPPYGE